MYRVTPCLVQPDVAVQSISSTATNSTQSTPLVSNKAHLRNPSTYAKLQNTYRSAAQVRRSQTLKIINYNKAKSSKNFSRSSFDKGTLPAPNSISGITDFSTGDYVDRFISTGYETVKVKTLALQWVKEPAR